MTKRAGRGRTAGSVDHLFDALLSRYASAATARRRRRARGGIVQTGEKLVHGLVGSAPIRGHRSCWRRGRRGRRSSRRRRVAAMLRSRSRLVAASPPLATSLRGVHHCERDGRFVGESRERQLMARKEVQWERRADEDAEKLRRVALWANVRRIYTGAQAGLFTQYGRRDE